MTLFVLAFAVVLPATSQQHDCSRFGCESDPGFHFQLLQYQMSATRAANHSEWIGKNGNMIRSGATTAVPPAVLSAGPSWTFTAPNNGLVRGSPLVDSKGNIYQSTIDGDMLKFTQKGQLLWNVSTGVHMPGNPALMGDVVFNVRQNGEMFAVNSDGKLGWQTRVCERTSEDTHTVTCFDKNSFFLAAKSVAFDLLGLVQAYQN